MDSRSLREKYIELSRSNPFTQHNGIEVVDVVPDCARLCFTIRPESLNPHGLVHGGAIFTLADNAAGCAASTDGRTYVTQSGDIHFLRAQASGLVRAEAQVKHRGRSTVLVDVSVTGEEERLLATASFTYFCVDGSEIARRSPAAARQA